MIAFKIDANEAPGIVRYVKMGERCVTTRTRQFSCRIDVSDTFDPGKSCLFQSSSEYSRGLTNSRGVRVYWIVHDTGAV